MVNILSRMLMNGLQVDDDAARDITAGAVFGVYYTYDENDNKMWQKGKAPVVFPWSNRNPTHQ